MIPASNNFVTSFFTTSLIIGFSLLWCSLEVLQSSSSIMRCIQIEGLIPLRSVILYPKAVGYFLRICKSFSVSVSPSFALTITGRSSSESRNSYLRFLGSVLSSRNGFLRHCVGSGAILSIHLNYYPDFHRDYPYFQVQLLFCTHR